MRSERSFRPRGVAIRGGSRRRTPLRSHRPALLATLLALAATGCAGSLGGHLAGRDPSRRWLTSSGAVRSAALSPDGRLAAWIDGDGEPALWWRDQASGQVSLALRSMPGRPLREVSFAGEGDTVLLVGEGPDGGMLLARSLAGGPTTLLLQDVAAPVSASPDGTQLAFTRRSGDGSELVVARRDGSDLQVLARSPAPQGFAPLRVGWSPDSSRIACAGRQPASLRVVEVATGQVHALPGGPWTWTSGIAWPWPGHLLVTATRAGVVGMQAWRVDVSTGVAEPMTRGLVNLSAPTASTGAAAWLAMGQVQSSELWHVALQGDERRRLRGPATVEGQVDGYGGLVALPGGGIIQASRTLEGLVLETLPAGKGPTRLMLRMSEGGSVGQPALSGDGHLLAYQVNHPQGPTIWLAALDGAAPRRLVGPPGGVSPTFGGDGAVYYTAAGRPDTWRVTLDGGEPSHFASDASQCAAAPSGTSLACFVRGGLGLLSLPEGRVGPVLSAPGARPPVRWTRDGRALLYATTANETATLWLQPVDGAARRPLLEVVPGFVYAFDATPDRSAVLVVAGRHATDVLLVQP
jgi:hypothetical protein